MKTIMVLRSIRLQECNYPLVEGKLLQLWWDMSVSDPKTVLTCKLELNIAWHLLYIKCLSTLALRRLM